jgi:hypothetical protein
LGLTVKTADGKRAKLNGASLFMTVRKQRGGIVLIAKTTPASNGIEITNANQGEATITLSITDTEGLELGEHRFDAWVTYPGSPSVRHPVVQDAQMHVIGSITDDFTIP